MNHAITTVLAALVLSACAATPTPAPVTAQTTPTAAASAAPPAAVVIIHEVADFDTWKPVFDADVTTRKAHKITQAHVNRSADNPNLVAVYLAADSAAAIQEFAGDPSLKAAMAKGGVKGEPKVIPMSPTEDHAIKDRALAGAILQLKVASYDTWKSTFDGNAADRAKAGILGHAVNRVDGDPSTVVVYLQAQSVDTLRAFTASPELRATQQRAGVQGPPQITYWQGSVWGR